MLSVAVAWIPDSMPPNDPYGYGEFSFGILFFGYLGLVFARFRLSIQCQKVLQKYNFVILYLFYISDHSRPHFFCNTSDNYFKILEQSNLTLLIGAR